VLSLVLFASDVLSLAPPPTRGNDEPFEARLREVFGDEIFDGPFLDEE
jgi:hypothetical protein